MEELMTETEYLLTEARDITRRALGEASEAAVLVVFARLCAEIDAVPMESPELRAMH